MSTEGREPYQPLDLGSETFEGLPFSEVADGLVDEESYASAGRNARTLVMGQGMSVVLTVVRAGTTIHEHKAPGPVTIVGVRGRVRLSPADGGSPVSIEPGSGACFSAALRHSVEAEEDSAFIIIIGGKASGGAGS